jgi:hypothetical protein
MRTATRVSLFLASAITASPALANNVFVRNEGPQNSVVTVGDLKASASTVTFPESEVFADQPIIPVTFTNNGGTPVRITEVLLRSASATKLEIVGDSCAADAEISPQASCALSLKWTPTDPQRLTATLLLRHTGPSKEVAVQVNGVAKLRADGKIPNALIASPSSIKLGPDKGNGGRITRAQTVVLTNTLAQPMPINSIALLTSDPGLDISTGSCRGLTELPAKSSCDLRVVWHPTSQAGWKTDILVTFADSNNVLPIPVEIGQAEATSSTAAAAPSTLPPIVSPAPTPTAPAAEAFGQPGFLSHGRDLELRGVVDGAAMIKMGDQTRMMADGSTVRYAGSDWTLTIQNEAVLLSPRHATQRSIRLRVAEEPEYIATRAKPAKGDRASPAAPVRRNAAASSEPR